MSKIAVLMSAYNGEKFIKKQIDSILKQTVPVDLIIRDDGSSDSTVEIIQDYSSKHSNIRISSGGNLGFAKSFWSLIQDNEGYDYYALCDQDDVWLPDKIERALDNIREHDNEAALYTCDVSFIDGDNNPIKMPSFIGTVPDNYQVFLESVIPGCTFVFNSRARDYIIKYNGRMYAHDRAIYAIVRTFGVVIFDPKPYILYRIHTGNTFGTQSKFKEYFGKAKIFFKKNPNIRSTFAYDFYNTYKDYLPNSIAKDIYLLGHYREKGSLKKQLLFESHFRGIIFKMYVLLNKM